MADAMAFLKGILSEALLPVRTIEMEAKGASHSMDIIRRTKKKLNIEARKDQEPLAYGGGHRLINSG